MKRILLIFGALLLPTFAAADVLTWDECERIAFDANPTLRSARSAYEATSADYKGSYNGVLPSVSLNNSYTRSSNDAESGRWQASGSASVNLFDMSAFSSIRLASAGLDRSAAALADTSSSVLFSLRQSFAGLLFAQEQSIVAERVREIRDRNARLVSLRYNSGRESKGNMMRARAELFQSQRDVAQASRSLRTARQSLGEQLGRTDFEVLVVTGTLSIAPPPSQVPPDLAQIADNRPSVAVQRATVEGAEAALSRSKSGLWPILSASYTRSFRGESWFPGDPGWVASGVLSYPLFGGGLTSVFYDSRSAQRTLKAAEEDLRSARNAARTDLESSYASVAGASEDIEVQSAFLDAARQRNAEADIRYSNGLMSYEDWERIVSERVSFEQGLIRAQRDAVVAEAAWDRASGKVMMK